MCSMCGGYGSYSMRKISYNEVGSIDDRAEKEGEKDDGLKGTHPRVE